MQQAIATLTTAAAKQQPLQQHKQQQLKQM
jgi:hypothetical protein